MSPKQAAKRVQLDLGDGTVDAPEGWYALSPTDLAKDAPQLVARLSAKPSVAPPHLHLSRLPTPTAPAQAALDALVAALTESIPRVKILERGATRFDDGSAAVHALLALEAAPGRRTLMLHVLRDDVHLVGAAAEQDKARLLGELVDVLRTFRRS